MIKRMPGVATAAMLLVLVPAPGIAPGLAATPAASPDAQLARVQMHRSGNRGQGYLPRARDDGRAEPARFSLRARRVIWVPGDGTENLRANLYPIDVDGDRRLELVQFDGYRFIRVLTQDGRTLWEVRNPKGRLHRSHVHRDTAAVIDGDGDGRQDIVHCWAEGRGKQLVLRRGDDGRVLRQVSLSGQSARGECQIAAFKVAGRGDAIVLVAHDNPACRRGSVDTFAQTVAFDRRLRRLWQRDTCDAGHYAWPLDEDQDGRAEAVFVGKYLLSPGGSVRCVLPGFGRDHVDSMVIADLDPRRRGHEAVAVGASGTRIYKASSCGLLATARDVRRAQWVAAARLTPGAPPTIMVRARERHTSTNQPLYRIDASGRVLGTYIDRNPRHQTPTVNANLDGAARAEDMVTWFGQVIDAQGRPRLDTSWYWNLGGLSRKERRLSPYDQWTNAPVVVDLDRDGRDELVTWGRRVIVIGSRAP